MTDVELRSGPASLRVSPAGGGRFVGLRVDDLELLGAGGTGLYHWGSYPMAPYAGRVRRGRLTWAGRRHQLPIQLGDHAIHGVTVDRPWQVTDTSRTTLSLRCAFDARWPWAGHVEQHLSLTDDRLDAVLEVHADEPMPAWTGYHPWFARRLSRGGPVEIDLHAAGLLPRDGDGMPSPEPVPVPPGPWDDCFTGVTWPVVLRWPGALSLAVSADAPYAVVYDERPTAVCVEPQTAPPNAVELGAAATVDPSNPLRLTMTWQWSAG